MAGRFRGRPQGSSSWEQRCYDYLEVADDGGGSSGDDFEPSAEQLAAEASDIFLKLVCTLKMAGKLSAKHACLISYYAKQSGMRGSGTALAAPPGRTGGQYSDHFDEAVELKEHMRDNFYSLPVPSSERKFSGRIVQHLSASMLHLQLAAELENYPGIGQMVSEQAATSCWGDRWRSFLKEDGISADVDAKVLPLALYCDGVAYSNQKRNSVTGYWVSNLATQQKHLIFPMRKICAALVAARDGVRHTAF